MFRPFPTARPRPRLPRSSLSPVPRRAPRRADPCARTPPRARRDAPPPRRPPARRRSPSRVRRPGRRRLGRGSRGLPPIRRPCRLPAARLRRAPAHRSRDPPPASPNSPAAPACRPRAWRPGSSAPRAGRGAGFRRGFRGRVQPSPPRSGRAGSSTPRLPFVEPRRSRIARRRGSSRCRNRASRALRQVRSGRGRRSASWSHRASRWPWSATCRPRLAPCWRSPRGYGAGGRGCGKYRA